MQSETRPGSKMNCAGWCPFALIRCFFFKQQVVEDKSLKNRVTNKGFKIQTCQKCTPGNVLEKKKAVKM